MRIAVVSDIHGNWAALDTVLKDIARRKVDRVICLGDAVDPMPESRKVFSYLVANKIPILRGNHEDYVFAAVSDPNHKMNKLLQFLPVKVTASSFDEASAMEIANLPFTLTEKSSKAGDILFCHASPGSNLRGWRYELDDVTSGELKACAESTIVCGHWHDPETRDWENKRLVAVGSVGVPFGHIAAEYAILSEAQGHWEIEHLAVPYDPTPTLEAYAQSGWLKAGGPMGWILFHEVAVATRTIVPFYKWLKERVWEPKDISEWAQAVQEYLKLKGDWSVVDRYLNRI